MPDREKVIKALHDARRYLEDKEWSDRGASPHIDSINDALALLKEQEDLGTELTNAVELIHKKNERIEKLLKDQEAVEPNVSSAEQRCGNCNKVIEMDGWQSCPWCGKMIDWERWWNENGTHDNS